MESMNARRRSVFLTVLMLLLLTWSHASSTNSMKNKRHGVALGSAAIASITETLSPILPFTGGVDLRRFSEEEQVSWYDTTASLVTQVRNAFWMDHTSFSSSEEVFAISRGGGSSSTRVHSPTNKKRSKKSTASFASPISNAKSFIPLQKIAELTLSDLTELFDYAVKRNQQGFDRLKFLSKSSSERIKYMIQEMDAAVSKSRGSSSVISSTTILPPSQDNDTTSTTGTMDALYFCAVLRLFAEWRILRQVPEGYKGYAVGMNLGHKDIVQNLAKLETAVHDYMLENEESTSPTLRDLLEYEISQNLHAKLPRLKEKSAAMGLLWVRRQLQYQTCIFGNILRVPDEFPTSLKAIAHAYSSVYGEYHGWAVQKIFNYSFQAAPNVVEIYKYMNPNLLEVVRNKAAKRSVVVASSTRDGEEKQSSTVDDSTNNNNKKKEHDDNKNPIERLLHHVGGELDKFGKHIGSEWDKLVENVVRVFDQDSAHNNKKREAAATRVRGGSDDTGGEVDYEEMERFISERMEQDAHERIVGYLGRVEPLLDDLADLFDDLNMDDPTKV